MLNYSVTHGMNFSVDGHVLYRGCGFTTLAICILDALKRRRDLTHTINITWQAENFLFDCLAFRLILKVGVC